MNTQQKALFWDKGYAEAKKVSIAKIKKETDWATKGKSDDPNWVIHYAGYKEAVSDIIKIIQNI